MPGKGLEQDARAGAVIAYHLENTLRTLKGSGMLHAVSRADFDFEGTISKIHYASHYRQWNRLRELANTVSNFDFAVQEIVPYENRLKAMGQQARMSAPTRQSTTRARTVSMFGHMALPKSQADTGMSLLIDIGMLLRDGGPTGKLAADKLFDAHQLLHTHYKGVRLPQRKSGEDDTGAEPSSAQVTPVGDIDSITPDTRALAKFMLLSFQEGSTPAEHITLRDAIHLRLDDALKRESPEAVARVAQFADSFNRLLFFDRQARKFLTTEQESANPMAVFLASWAQALSSDDLTKCQQFNALAEPLRQTVLLREGSLRTTPLAEKERSVLETYRDQLNGRVSERLQNPARLAYNQREHLRNQSALKLLEELLIK